MGAAGYVTVYRENEVRDAYKRLWPDNDIDADWWYLKTCSADVFGTRLIFDYADDQGYHEGTENEFWFTAEHGPKDETTGRYEWYEQPDKPEGGFGPSYLKSQRRVLAALSECQGVEVEVWT